MWRLRRSQKDLSRKKPGSRRREKAKRRVARVHRKVSNQRSDFLHKLTTDLTREYDLICLEDLNTKGLAKTELSGSVLDAAFGEFVSAVWATLKNGSESSTFTEPPGLLWQSGGIDVYGATFGSSFRLRLRVR